MKNLVAVLVTALAFIAGPANAAVVFSDNFNAEPLALGVTNLAKWTVDSPNVDVIGFDGTTSSYDFYSGQGLGNYLDLDGTGDPTNATITTIDSFGPGSYVLTFLLGNNPGGNNTPNTLNTLTVSLGNISASVPTANWPVLQSVMVSFTTNVAGSLKFIQGGPQDQQGSIIDNVVLDQLSADPQAVPEPGSIATVLTGIAAVGIGRWRRSRRA